MFSRHRPANVDRTLIFIQSMEDFDSLNVWIFDPYIVWLKKLSWKFANMHSNPKFLIFVYFYLFFIGCKYFLFIYVCSMCFFLFIYVCMYSCINLFFNISSNFFIYLFILFTSFNNPFNLIFKIILFFFLLMPVKRRLSELDEPRSACWRVTRFADGCGYFNF